MGIVPSAFYRHFKSKDEVLDAVSDQLQAKLLGNVAAVRKETDQAPERLKRLLRRHVRLLAEKRAIPQMVFSDGISTGHPARKAKVKAIVAGYLAEVRSISEGQKEGTLLAGLSPGTVAVMFLGPGSANGGGPQSYRKPFRRLNRYVAQAWPVFKEG